MNFDLGLLDYCLTDEQREVVKVVCEKGGFRPAEEPHEHNAVRIDGVDFHNSLNGDKVQKSIAKNKQLHIDRQRTMRKAGAMFTGSTSMDI